jgi:hypothetical protein
MESRSQKKKKNKNMVGPNHITSQEPTAEIPNQGNQSGVPIPESYALPIYPPFILSRDKRDPSSCFSPRIRNRTPKEKRRRRKFRSLVFQEKDERRWLNVCDEYTDLCCMIGEGEGKGKNQDSEKERVEKKGHHFIIPAF